MGTAGPWANDGTKTKRNQRFSTGPPPGEKVALCSLASEEQFIVSLSCLCQGWFIVFLEDLGAGWDTGAARSYVRLDVLASMWSRHGTEQFWRPKKGTLVDGQAEAWGMMCWIASVCFCTAKNCRAKSSTVSPNSPGWEMGASRKHSLSKSLISARMALLGHKHGHVEWLSMQNSLANFIAISS